MTSLTIVPSSQPNLGSAPATFHVDSSGTLNVSFDTDGAPMRQIDASDTGLSSDQEVVQLYSLNQPKSHLVAASRITDVIAVRRDELLPSEGFKTDTTGFNRYANVEAGQPEVAALFGQNHWNQQAEIAIEGPIVEEYAPPPRGERYTLDSKTLERITPTTSLQPVHTVQIFDISGLQKIGEGQKQGPFRITSQLM